MAATAFDSSTKSPAPTSIYKKGAAFKSKGSLEGHPSWAPASTEEFVKDKTDKRSNAEVNAAMQISTSEVAAEAEFEELFQKFDADADDTSLRRRWNELDKLKMLSSFPEFQERFAKVKDALDARVDKRKAENEAEKTEKKAKNEAKNEAKKKAEANPDNGTDTVTDNGASSSSGSSTDRPKKAPKAPLPPRRRGLLAILTLAFGHSEVNSGNSEVNSGNSEVNSGHSEVKFGHSEVNSGHSEVKF
jgi:hypothetical protein